MSIDSPQTLLFSGHDVFGAPPGLEHLKPHSQSTTPSNLGDGDGDHSSFFSDDFIKASMVLDGYNGGHTFDVVDRAWPLQILPAYFAATEDFAVSGWAHLEQRRSADPPRSEKSSNKMPLAPPPPSPPPPPPPPQENIPSPCFGDKGKGVRPPRVTPKKQDLQSQFSHHAGPVVTLMICNIPCRVTQQQLVDVVDGIGFGGKYDFLYLPTGGRSSTAGSSNLGYGFINFVDPGDADLFTQRFMNYQFDGTSSSKVCLVKPAHIQGLENNIVHFDRTAAKGRPRREGPIICPAVNMMTDKKTKPYMMTDASTTASTPQTWSRQDSPQDASTTASTPQTGPQGSIGDWSSWLEASLFEGESQDYVVAYA